MPTNIVRLSVDHVSPATSAPFGAAQEVADFAAWIWGVNVMAFVTAFVRGRGLSR
jgi:hypothetical protein